MSRFAGVGPLLRVALRRDRWVLPSWTAGLFAYAIANSVGTVDLYPTAASRAVFATGLAANKATIALYGPASDLGSLGGLATWKLSGLGAALVGLMCVLVVTRHTRADEEAGRLELVGAGAVGRSAPLAVGVLMGLLAATCTAVACWIGLWAGGITAGDSLVFSAGVAAVGAVFVGVGAVTAQLSDSARRANGIGLGVLGATYLFRAVGDVMGAPGVAWPSWGSPIGWAQRIHPFGRTRPWVFLLLVAAAATLVAAAGWLRAHRDLGAGLLAPRDGPATASAGLRSPLALAWRLDRGTVAGWCTGLVVLGAATGAIASGVADLVGGNRAARDLIEKLGGHGALVDAYLSTIIGFLGLLVAAFAVQAVLRLHLEEVRARVEPVLAAPVGRLRWASGHLLVAAVGSAALLAAGGAAAGAVHGARVGDIGGQTADLVVAALVQWPAAMVVAGVAVLLHGAVPRAATAAWGVLAVCLLLGELGPVLDLPHLVMDLSPFSHLPALPGVAVTAEPLVLLTLVAIALAAAGLAAFRRRDLAT